MESRNSVDSIGVSIRRRDVLTLSTTGLATGLAGCAINDEILQRTGGDSKPMLSEDVTGTVFVIPIHSNPAEISTVWDLTPPQLPYHTSRTLYLATHEPCLMGRWWSANYWWDPGESIPGLFSSVSIGDETISIGIREGARWSDGEPIRANDIVANFAIHRIPPESGNAVEWAPEPSNARVVDAVGGYSLPNGPDGTAVEFHLLEDRSWADIGGFEAIPPGELLYHIGGPAPQLGVRFPSHIGPFDSIAEEAVSAFDHRRDDVRPIHEIADEHVTESVIENLREPDRFVSSGPWTIDEFVDSQGVVLTPNEHHRLATELTIDTVTLEWLSHSRITQELRHAWIDYASHWVATGQYERFPDSIERVYSPRFLGRSIAFDHSTEFGERVVRQAMAYAIDIASLIEPRDMPGTKPITVPGAQLWGIEGVIDAEWAKESLLSYDIDIERATAILEDAGYRRNDDDVWERAGRTVSGAILTDGSDPIAEELVIQLRQFGYDIELYSISQAGTAAASVGAEFYSSYEFFKDRWQGDRSTDYIPEEDEGSGDFELWSGDRNSDVLAGTVRSLLTHWTDGLSQRPVVRARNYFDHDDQEAVVTEYTDAGWMDGSYGDWLDWTIELPPTGDPAGERRPFNPAYTAASVLYGRHQPSDPQPENPYYHPPHEVHHAENARYFWRRFAWAANWWLPVLPLYRGQRQHFIERDRWRWPPDLTDPDAEYLWEYFGDGWSAPTLLSMGFIEADEE